MRRYTIVLIWYVDGGMAGSSEDRREFTIDASPDDVEDRAYDLQCGFGAFDYEIVEL